MKLFIIAGLILISVLRTQPVQSQESLSDTHPDVEKLTETMVVVGDRSERPLIDVAGTIDLKTEEALDRELAQSLADLFRYSPGISSGGTGSRAGFGGFTIRGIGGNRVLTLVDGIRVSDAFSFGPFLNAGRDFIDIDTIQQAELARGPISSLYGSDALGGVVAVTTKKARDYLDDGQPIYAATKFAIDGADSGNAGRFTVAAGNAQTAFSLSHKIRRADAAENQGIEGGIGPQRETADPQENDVRDTLANASWVLAEHTVDLVVDQFEADTDVNVLSDSGTALPGPPVPPGVINTLFGRNATDARQRQRVSLHHLWAPP